MADALRRTNYPAPDAGDIVSLGEERAEEVTALFTRAFHDDPLFVYACPNPLERSRWLPWMLRWSVWKGYLFGKTLGTAGRLDGAASVVGPGGGTFTEEDLARFAYRRGREIVGEALWDRCTDRLNDVFEPIDEELHRVVPEPRWYLDAIAVDPRRHGAGIGSRLLQVTHARADADGLPVVLITFQPRNLPLYHRHGFAVVCEAADPASGLRSWGLGRIPNAARVQTEPCHL